MGGRRFFADRNGDAVTSNPRLFSFIGGDAGEWIVIGETLFQGTPLTSVTHLSIRPAGAPSSSGAWTLQGVASNTRYVTREEKSELVSVEPTLGRAEAALAVMIPMRKNADWWSLTQEDRRDIFHRSGHHSTGLQSLPAIARRLHHCRDLASAQAFDFITWFEFAPEHASVFDELISAFRETEEWQYVDREYEMRFVKNR